MESSKRHSQRQSRRLSSSFLISFMMMMIFHLQIIKTAASRAQQRTPAAAFLTPFSSTARTTIAKTTTSFSVTTTTKAALLPSLRLFSSNIDNEEEILESGYRRPTVQWYPGHIAKAERQLSETLKAVDVVVEVRDARACKATAHPRVGEWCAGSPRIVVLTHLDMIPKQAARAWRLAYENLGAERWDDAPINTQVANQAQQARDVRFQFQDPDSTAAAAKKSSNNNNSNNGQQNDSTTQRSSVVTPVEQVLFVNAKQGQGIHALHRAIFKAGTHVQERRERRGLKARPLRVGIIGYPNVGKSALINRILGRKRARTANTPGVTRSLQWIRVRTDDSKTSLKKEFELLDSPGIIPAKMVDQSDALILAACNCIGSAAYDNQAVAAYLCEWLKAIYVMEKDYVAAPEWRQKCKERYGFDPMKPLNEETGEMLTGDDMLYLVADNVCRGDPEDASRKILQDFRTGRMGPISLQVAPETEDDNGQMSVLQKESSTNRQNMEARRELAREEQQARARLAVETAKERGLELPPMILEQGGANNNKEDDDDVGKGMFDGW